jgi:GDPmannose 4,6-dehydratase
VLASGQPHTVEELAQIAFAHAGLDPRDHIEVDPALVRPPDSAPLVGDPTLARQRLGWRATLDFEQLVQRMVDADLRALVPPVA